MAELTTIGRKIAAYGQRSAYDAQAISLLSDRQFLSRILKDCTFEFANMELPEIEKCIEDPFVGMIPVEPGLTHSSLAAVSVESKIAGEGVLTYDIRFSVNVPAQGKLQIRLLIDVEVQNSENPGYDLVSRGILYAGRMLSEQMGHNVTGRNYDALNKVYSIWICMNCADSRANTIARYSVRQDALYGTFTDTSRYDLLQVILLRLPKTQDKKLKNRPTKLMETLSVLLSKERSAKEKLEKMKTAGILVSEEMEGRVNTMCNLSQGIFEDGVKVGEERGIERGKEQGMKQGMKQGEDRFAALMDQLFQKNLPEDAQRAAKDPEFRHMLYKKYDLI